jgi:hypothetical protein
MEHISWPESVKKEQELHAIKEKRYTAHTIKRKKENCVGHILPVYWLLENVIEHTIEGRIEVTDGSGWKMSKKS